MIEETKPPTTTITRKVVGEEVPDHPMTLANIGIVAFTIAVSVPMLLIVGHALPLVDCFFQGLKPLVGILGFCSGIALIVLIGLSLWYVHDWFRVDIKKRIIEARKFKVDPQSGNYDAYFNTNEHFAIPKSGVMVPPVPHTYAPQLHFINRVSTKKDEEVTGSLVTNVLEAPKTPTLSDQIQSGETTQNETTSIIGYYTDGKAFRAKIFGDSGNLFNSCFIFGDQGYGKSTFATYLAALTILQGGKLIVIDPESEDPQALSKRLGPLAQERYLLCPIADTPEKATRAVRIAREQIEIIDNHAVLMLIDEFTLIARQAASGRGPWAEAGPDIIDVSEEYATRGRKKRCRVICLGQIPKAERSGGTEVRDSMATVCFNLKKERAQRILETDEAAQAPSLKIGEIILAPSTTTYRLQLPYPDKEGLEKVVSMGLTRKFFTEPLEPFHDVSLHLQDTNDLGRNFELQGEMIENAVKEAEKTVESIPEFSREDESQILDITRVHLATYGRVIRSKIPASMKPPRNNKFYPVVKYICDREGL